MIEAHSEEIEVLQSIFPEEFELISDSPSEPSFKLHLSPSDEEKHVAITLICSLPSLYPDETLPLMSIEIEKGLSHTHVDELMTIATEVATTNLGMPVIFAVAEAIKEWLVDNNVEGQDGSMYAGRFYELVSFHYLFIIVTPIEY